MNNSSFKVRVNTPFGKIQSNDYLNKKALASDRLRSKFVSTPVKNGWRKFRTAIRRPLLEIRSARIRKEKTEKTSYWLRKTNCISLQTNAGIVEQNTSGIDVNKLRM